MRLAVYGPWIYLKGGIERTLVELFRRSRHEWTVYTHAYDPENTFPELHPHVVELTPRISVERSLLPLARGAATILPPVEGKPYPHFVPAVDRDGNEVTGIRLPDLAVPLATYTGWNLRHPQMGASDRLMSLMGSTIPLPATPEDRARTRDPRRSLSQQGRLSRTGAAGGSTPH